MPPAKKLKSGAWLVSVPRRRGSTERVYATFALDVGLERTAEGRQDVQAQVRQHVSGTLGLSAV